MAQGAPTWLSVSVIHTGGATETGAQTLADGGSGVWSTVTSSVSGISSMKLVDGRDVSWL